MKEFTIIFNDFACYKYLRNGISDFIKDMIPHNSTLIEVALNEAVNNAIKHGNKKRIIVKLKIHKNRKLTIRVKDRGQGFQVYETLRKGVDASLAAEIDYSLLKESGRGLLIMNQIMDKVIYNKQGNDVILIKNLAKMK